MKQIPMTLQGSEQLRKELDYLKFKRRSEIVFDIAAAREHGDLKENSEYHAAREQQGFCEARIKEIESKLSNAQIIDITKIPISNRVVFGVTVNVKNLCNKEIKNYRIVGDDEANLKQNLISINSPIARGLIGKKIGSTTIINTPRGEVKYKILKIEHL